VVCGGLEKCAANYAVHRSDGFPYPSLEYVADGAGALSIGGSEHQLAAGRVFAYGPGVSLDIVTSRRRPLTKYFVCFSGTRAPALLREAGLPPGAVHDVFPPYAPVKLFEEIIDAGAMGGPRGQRLCASLLRSLALKLTSSPAPGNHVRSDAFETFRRCRAFMERNCLRLATQSEVARGCRIDPSYLCRLFQTYDHQTPYQCLMRLKMHHAATQLQHTGVSVKQAALAVGFADQLHFSRVFRRVLGIPPTALRGIR